MTKYNWSFLHEEAGPPPLPEGWYIRIMTSSQLEEEYPLALGDALKEFNVAYDPNQEWTVTLDENDAAKVTGYAGQGKEGKRGKR